MQSYAECLHVLQRVSGLQGAYLQLVRATPQEAPQYKEEERQARLQAIHDAAGHQSPTIITSTCLPVSCCLSDRLCLSLSAFLFLSFYVRLRPLVLATGPSSGVYTALSLYSHSVV